MKIGKIIDLTAPMFDGAPTMPLDPQCSISWHSTLETMGYNLSHLKTSTHQGTHIDAPRHFYNNGMCVDEIPLERLIVRAVKIDMTWKKPGEAIVPDDLQPESVFIEKGCNILIHTGWDKYFPNKEYFSGFQYISKELADWFVKKQVNIVGMDIPTPNGKDWKYVHLKMLGCGCLIVEGLTNLGKLPNSEEFTFFALPLKLQGRDGSPIRAIAILDSVDK
ncbi:MAG: cyclase family protein [Prevotellaceae bacterium]|jgi:kynurenine formamidase|nr:cyclase family protein [Prevotellaceae bacterium]